MHRSCLITTASYNTHPGGGNKPRGRHGDGVCVGRQHLPVVPIIGSVDVS